MPRWSQSSSDSPLWGLETRIVEEAACGTADKSSTEPECLSARTDRSIPLWAGVLVERCWSVLGLPRSHYVQPLNTQRSARWAGYDRPPGQQCTTAVSGSRPCQALFWHSRVTQAAQAQSSATPHGADLETHVAVSAHEYCAPALDDCSAPFSAAIAPTIVWNSLPFRERAPV